MLVPLSGKEPTPPALDAEGRGSPPRSIRTSRVVLMNLVNLAPSHLVGSSFIKEGGHWCLDKQHDVVLQAKVQLLAGVF